MHGRAIGDREPGEQSAVVGRAFGCEGDRCVDVFDSHGDGLVVRKGPHRSDRGIELLVEMGKEFREQSRDIRHASGIGECPGIGRTFLAQCKRNADNDGKIGVEGVAVPDPPINIGFDQFRSHTG